MTCLRIIVKITIWYKYKVLLLNSLKIPTLQGGLLVL